VGLGVAPIRLGIELGFELSVESDRLLGFALGFELGVESDRLLGFALGFELGVESDLLLGFALGFELGTRALDFVLGLELGFALGVESDRLVLGLPLGFALGVESDRLLGLELGFALGFELGTELGMALGVVSACRFLSRASSSTLQRLACTTKAGCSLSIVPRSPATTTDDDNKNTTAAQRTSCILDFFMVLWCVGFEEGIIKTRTGFNKLNWARLFSLSFLLFRQDRGCCRSTGGDITVINFFDDHTPQGITR